MGVVVVVVGSCWGVWQLSVGFLGGCGGRPRCGGCGRVVGFNGFFRVKDCAAPDDVVDEAVVQISGGGVDGWADAADTTTEYNPVGATYVGA